MNRIILLISIFCLFSCVENHKNKEYHKLTDKQGYCYQDDNLLWHLYYFNELTGQYDYTSSTSAPSYDLTVDNTFSPSAESVSNYSESSMAESTGEATGGSDASEADASGGMSESSGESTGGSDSGSDSSSDSGSSDGGGSDGGGGDGGGGGE